MGTKGTKQLSSTITQFTQISRFEKVLPKASLIERKKSRQERKLQTGVKRFAEAQRICLDEEGLAAVR